MPFQGKVAVVTGGSKGIGRAAAQLFAQGGAATAIVSLHDPQDTVREIRVAARHEQVIGIQANVSHSEQVRLMVQQVSDAFGGVDILVNSAGIQRYGNVVDTDEELWDQVIDTNLKGMFLTSKYCIPVMRKRGGGAIVHVSSVQAYAAQKGVAAYSASKGGINALTRAMAIDHASEGIRVNAVCPASVDTPMLRSAADLLRGEASQESLIESWGTMHPVGRVGTPEEVAHLITYLCSDKASFITGADIKIDGGLLSAIGVTLPE